MNVHGRSALKKKSQKLAREKSWKFLPDFAALWVKVYWVTKSSRSKDSVLNRLKSIFDLPDFSVPLFWWSKATDFSLFLQFRFEIDISASGHFWVLWVSKAYLEMLKVVLRGFASNVWGIERHRFSYRKIVTFEGSNVTDFPVRKSVKFDPTNVWCNSAQKYFSQSTN